MSGEAAARRDEEATIRRSVEFRRAIREGTRVSERGIVLYVLPREGSCRAGFMASRRLGGAVRRNRAKRRLREAWRAVAPDARDGFDVVFAARRELAGLTMPELIQQMRRGLERSGVVSP